MIAPNPDSTVEDSIPLEAVDSAPPQLLPHPPARSKTTLAKCISSRTTDLLAIAIVLIGSLTLGRQMLEWWREEPPAVLDGGPMANVETEWGAGGKPVQIEFADSPVRLIRQTVFEGGPLVALGLIQENCQVALLDARPPESPPDPPEIEMLRTVSGRQPDAEQPGLWQIHRLGGSMVTLIGVRFFSPNEQKTGAASTAPAPRVVCWGLAFPGGSTGSWTAYTFIKSNNRPNSSVRIGSKKSKQPTGLEKATAQASVKREKHAEFELGEVPLPGGCRRTLLVQESAWNSLLGFQGTGSVAEWREHFSTWFESQGWTRISDWQADAGTTSWSTSFSPPKPVNPQENNPQENPASSNRVFIQLQFDLSGQGSGLIHGLPGQSESR